jgi:hypothetical protein
VKNRKGRAANPARRLSFAQRTGRIAAQVDPYEKKPIIFGQLN